MDSLYPAARWNKFRLREQAMNHEILAMLVKQGQIFDLGQTLEMGMPIWPGHPPYLFSLFRRHGDVRRGSGLGAAEEVIVLGGHSGTHLDALCHVSRHGILHGGLSADQAQRGRNGMAALGIEMVPPIVRRGVLLDAAGAYGAEALPADTRLTSADLQQIAASHRLQIRSGDCVLVRTGWGRYWPDASRYVSVETGAPGPDDEACRWLADQQIYLVGADTPGFEFISPKTPHLPGHLTFIVGRGIYILENLNLESLAAANVYEFVLICLPLKIVGGTGSPLRPIAIA